MQIINRITEKINNYSIVTKLILLFILTSTIIFVVNIYMYVNINKTVGIIDNVYVSNANLNELTEVLSEVQNNMYEYLDTKNSDALENYYRSAGEFSNLVYELNDTISDNNIKLMERKIRNMSLKYLETTNKTIQSKRGRNIEKYKKGYEEASGIYEYINTNIYSLNNEQFLNNSNNYELLLVSLKYLESISIIILIVVSLLNVILIIIMTNNLTKPLKKLALAANEVAAGNFDIELPEVNNNDEIGVVAKTFNKMIVNIKEYIIRIKVSMEYESKLKENELMMKNHLKDAQLKYLQAQINPHFLFNTLNAGVQLAIMEDADKTSIFIEKTADFFRYNIKKINEDARLKEEIELVNNYIYIMSVRFSEEINYIKQIDDTLLDIKVPSMILQPIIENAINYGIRDIEWEGRIELSIFRQLDKICISVRDNGKGISQDTIDRIIRGESNEIDLAMSSNGIGLRNVISRLNLYYAREDVLLINSKGMNKGTEVLINIPANNMTEKL